MKIVLATALMILSASVGHAAGVADFGASVQRHTPACAMGLPRIARTAALPQACCDGATCGQKLATTKIERPQAASRT